MKVHNPSTVSPVPEKFAAIYSHAIETQLHGCRQLHISGQVGGTADGVFGETFAEQFTQAIKNVEAILAAADMSTDHIVKVVYYLTRREDLSELVKLRQELWYGVNPAVTTLLVAGLFEPDWYIEVDVVAIVEASEAE